jgi:hypothetical protein
MIRGTVTEFAYKDRRNTLKPSVRIAGAQAEI